MTSCWNCKMATATTGSSGSESKANGQGTAFSFKPGKCRVCSDFKSWSKTQTFKSLNTQQKECPADREDLGRCTWLFLHTMAAYYPDSPTGRQQEDMKRLVSLFSQFYPCDDCAEHMRTRLETHPPDTTDRVRFSRWMCELHNEVNQRLGKRTFDCSKVDERWLEGWKDGSCD